MPSCSQTERRQIWAVWHFVNRTNASCRWKCGPNAVGGPTWACTACLDHGDQAGLKGLDFGFQHVLLLTIDKNTATIIILWNFTQSFQTAGHIRNLFKAHVLHWPALPKFLPLLFAWALRNIFYILCEPYKGLASASHSYIAILKSLWFSWNFFKSLDWSLLWLNLSSAMIAFGQDGSSLPFFPTQWVPVMWHFSRRSMFGIAAPGFLRRVILHDDFELLNC